MMWELAHSQVKFMKRRYLVVSLKEIVVYSGVHASVLRMSLRFKLFIFVCTSCRGNIAPSAPTSETFTISSRFGGV